MLQTVLDYGPMANSTIYLQPSLGRRDIADRCTESRSFETVLDQIEAGAARLAYYLRNLISAPTAP